MRLREERIKVGTMVRIIGCSDDDPSHLSHSGRVERIFAGPRPRYLVQRDDDGQCLAGLVRVKEEHPSD